MPAPSARDDIPARPASRRALALGAAAAAVVACGLAVRGLPGIVGDAAGGILYAALVYLLLALGALVLRTTRVGPAQLAAAAVVLCTLVELFQLTGWPARLGETSPLLHLVLGSTFNAWDLPAYAAGAAAACLADRTLGWPARRNETVDA
ncbi:DUF2809 domain-containing protein [Arthrobacter sp. Sa2CUA1]|uniref:DUF2809 domain-containing protein n=1 Tax=Arthrobacter gallicola TaxID=2762225 RepID=A0ABR8UMU7_9MICC|nr:DUF2809 domain-containing protein [Arthrobacter gallicola]MBD7993878.1 DUF2809 domain-containing protein [Arthrobacter gallicola]